MWLMRVRQSLPRLLKLTLTLSISMLLTCSVFANPVLDNVAAGQVSVQQTPGTTVVNQSSQQAILNWQSFNIGQGESTHFNQPAGGIALNRINPTAGASQIYGSLTATGQIILINPAGVYFGPSAYVNVGGLIATTSNITDQNFMNGLYQFSKVDGYNGAIVNEGTIVAAQNGLIALVAPGVINKGLIQANLGKVVLGSGEAFTLNFSGDNLINFAVNTSASATDKDGNSLPAGITNTGSLIANGGTIMLSAKSAAGVLDNVINLEGVAQAKSIYEDQGKIIISSDPDAGIVRVAANIDASGKGAGQKGGTVQITGHNILIDSPTSIDVSGDAGGGNVNIGGSYQGKGPLANANAVVMMPNAMINANAITSGNGGNVVLWADNVTKFYGSILSQGGLNSGNGGLVETSGKAYLDANGGYVNTLAANGQTGTWLLDPTNIYIAVNQAAATTAGMVGTNTSANTVAAGVFQASGVVQDSLLTTGNLVTALGTSNINVTTTNASGTGVGNITVVSPITWASGNALTLTAANNIVINAAISGVNGSLNLNAANIAQSITTGAAGSVAVRNFNLVQGQWYQVGTLPSFSVTNNFQINSGVMPNAVAQFIRATSGNGTTTPFTITDIYGLQGIGSTATTLGYNYALANSINASGTSTWNSAAGFVPIGTSATPFTGNTVLSTNAITFEGNNFTISNLFINRPATSYVGLFGALFINADPTNSYTIQNVGLTNANVTGGAWTGALVGGLIGTTRNMNLINTYMTGTVSSAAVGDAFVGGLFGEFNGNVLNSYAISTVTAAAGNKVGGLGGSVRENGNTTTISGNYSLSTVNGLADVGGLIGEIQGANGSISLSNVYSGGSVTGTTNVGGLIGRMTNNVVLNFNSLTNSYSFAKVAGTTNVGGLVGQLNSVNTSSTNTVANSFATGYVTGTTAVGGLIGLVDAYIVTNNNFWDTETTGQATSAVGTGQTTAQMMAQTTYTGWDFASTWNIIEGQSYPYLRTFYTTTPRVISGTTGAAGGQTVQLAVNAALFDTTYTGANGFYYFLEGTNALSGINQTIADGSSLLTYITTGAVTGNGVALAPTAGGSLSGLNYAASTIGVGGDVASSFTNTMLGTAKGALVDTRILYSVSGANLTLGNATNLTANLSTSANTTYTVNGTIGMIASGVGGVTFNGTTNLNNSTLTTNGIQTYNGPVVLGASVTLASGNNNIVFNNTIDRDATARTLTINGGSGAITLGGNVGSGVNGALGAVTLNSTGVTTIGGTLASSTLATNAGGSTLLSGGAITTTSTQTYADAVTLGADTTLNSGAGAIAFSNTLNSDATPRNLTVNSSGATTFTGIIGGTNPLSSITTNATGTTTFANNATTVGDMIFNDNVVSSGVAKILTSNTGGITFNGTLTGTLGISLLSSTGITFNQNVGLTSTAALTVTGPATINAATISTAGNQTWNDTFTFTQPLTTLTATGAASNINIVQPLNWANSNTLFIAATGATGTITLPSSITTTNGGTIQLNAGPAQNLAAGGTIINVDGFNLVRGTWSQVGLVNPAFYAADFRLNSSGTPSSTTAFYRALGGDGTVATPYQLYDVYGLQGMGSGTTPLTQNYVLMNNLDMTPTSSWNSGTGWAPIGTAASVATRFSGVFDGNNFTLDNLTMNKAATYTALFGYIQGGTVRNLNLTNVNITSTGNNTGAVAGQLTGSALLDNINISGSISGAGITGGAVGRSLGSTPVSVNNVHFTGTVTGTGSVTGGLVGSMQNNNTENGIANSSANATVTGTNDVGGLLGEMQNNNADMYVTNSFATGTVTGVTSVGGLVGRMQGNNSVNPFINEIINSYSTSTVSGTTNVGGLIGQMRTTNINLLGFNTITNSFSSGQVNIIGTGTNVGGLVGYMNILSVINGSYSNVGSITDTTGSTNVGGLVGSNEGDINNAYTTTSVSGQATTNNIGGLVGNNAGNITNSYSIGSVNGNGSTTVGGLVGINTGTVTNSYWNTDTSGLVVSAAGIGLTTAQMQNQANYTGWDFATTWNIVDGQSYPFLRAFYTVAPRTISGTTNATGGTAVTFAANGTVLDTTYTGANGSYYFLAGNNLISGINSTIADGAAILAYLNSGGAVGNAVALAPAGNGSLSGFNIALNGLSIGYNGVATYSNTTLATALGGLAGNEFLYSTAGNNLTLGNTVNKDVAFNTTANTTYNLNGNINGTSGATNTSLSFGGTVNATANTTLTATAISFLNGLTGANNVDVVGQNANNTLTVKTSSAPTFNITSSNTGNVTGINSFLGLLGFTNIQNLTGSDNGNTFVVSNGAGITGTANGANLNSSNILDLTALTSAVSIVLTNTNDGSVTNAANNLIAAFANITTVNTNTSYANTITVPSGKNNDIFVTGAGSGYINDPIFFNGVNNFVGTGGSNVNFLTGAIYNAATNTYIVNGVPMSFSGFSSITGFTTPPVQTPGTIVNVIQQPPTNASQNNNAPENSSSGSTGTSTSPTWVLAGTTIDQNLTIVKTDLANDYDSNMKKVTVNPYCYSTQ